MNRKVEVKEHQYNGNDIHVELEKASEKYHIVGAWIAVIFDPLFSFTDYINIPDNWLTILYIRIFVALTTLVLLVIRNLTLIAFLII